MIDPRFDFMISPVAIPPQFWNVPYRAEHFPGAATTQGLRGGANCQQFAYEFLREHGYTIPNFRSSDLWEDRIHTEKIDAIEPFCLVLLYRTSEAWGAHVGVGLGNELVLHLSKAIGTPAIEPLSTMMSRSEYACLVGLKRALGGQADQRETSSPVVIPEKNEFN